MIPMKTLTMDGKTHEIVDAKARKDIRTTRAPSINQTVEGTIIAVNDSSSDPLLGLKIFGKTTQFTTTGKNLLNYTISPGTYTSAGVTYTVYEDGSVKANGTATDTSILVLNSEFTFDAGVTYKITGCPSGGSQTTYRLEVDEWVNDFGYGGVGNNMSGIVKAIQIRVESGTTISNKIFYPMIRLSSVTDATWEPYTAGVTPRPDYPQELVSAESHTVSVYGKNLLDETKLTYRPEYTDMYSSALTASDFHMKKGVTCTISFDTENTGVLMYVNPSSGFDYKQFTMDGNRHSFTSTFDSDVNGTVPLVSIAESSDVSCGLISNVQIEIGTSATNYEPYMDLQTVSVDRVVRGIPVSQNGNYTDENGQQWICDEIDFGRGVYIQRVGTKTIDGTIAPTVFAAGNVEGTSIGWPYEAIGMENIVRTRAPKMCDKLVAHPTSAPGSYKNAEIGEWIFNSNGSADSFLIFNVGEFETEEDARLWLVDNPVTFYYQMATPVTTVLSDEELEAFEAVCSNYPSTTIYNDSDAWMEVTYGADTKNFITNYMYGMVEVIKNAAY